MGVNEKPVFYDPSGRRKRRFALGVGAFLALVLVALVISALSIVALIPPPELPFDVEHPALKARPVRHQAEPDLAENEWLFNSLTRTETRPLAVGFHVPWDDASTGSLARYISQMDWVVPGWMFITGPDHQVRRMDDRRTRAIIANAAHKPQLLPMIQNAWGGKWDGEGIAALLKNPLARTGALERIEKMLVETGANGVFFDFEQLPASAHADYLAFLAEARERFHARRMIVTIAVPVDDPNWNLKAYAKVTDKLFLMAYDEHYQGGDAGPIASLDWMMREVREAAADIPREQLVVAIANYAYDWPREEGGAVEALAVDAAWLRARDSKTVPVYDPESGNSHYAYDLEGITHDVWITDAATSYDQIRALHAAGFNQLALWRLGTEDPSLWSLFGRGRRPPASANVLGDIPAGTSVDIEGAGEILRVRTVPVKGKRTLTQDADGRITDVRFESLPSMYTIERTGYRPGLVALTFDDGPDGLWTPRILDVLKAHKVPGTFFIVGESALENREVMFRMLAEGHELGNHTYTHPNLTDATEGETRIELNATQRLFQAFTGRSLRLFRAPYFGDAEPSTADEIRPAYAAQKLGYLNVGLHADPDDWKNPGVKHIVEQTVAQVEASNPARSSQIVLLHDGGGSREQTVAALPLLIKELQAKGYRFVRVSELAGLTREEVMPRISGDDQAAARWDFALFSLIGISETVLTWLFGIAIVIGIARVISLSALALLQARRESRTIFPKPDPHALVTVLIPAFNEEQVIEASVKRVLASTKVRVQVIVIDDGSTDRTSEIVRAAFAEEPQVTLLTLQNGGKARALNRGLELAQGEYVIALDADTQFEPSTISRLTRWFADPRIGAVAGNAKVGNRVNLVTRWQALEYISAQNLERRALASLNAITVVPGAVGAWRLSALKELGGYPADTLAEDQDLTIAIQRAGWQVHYDQYAVAWTEAPENFRALARQRFRWAYGTLQCLYKHSAILKTGKPRGLARVGLPQAILFQILFAAISPIIDLALVVALADTLIQLNEHGVASSMPTLQKMFSYWLIFGAVDLLGGTIAFALERREDGRLLALLLPQRFVYRQVMYYVVLKALFQAVRGRWVGWGKLERTGRVNAG